MTNRDADSDRVWRRSSRLQSLTLQSRDLSLANDEAPPHQPIRPLRVGRCRALLVGINAYPSMPLHNAAGDAAALGCLLERDFGFEPTAIELLIDQAATSERVLQALDLMLGESSEPHDQNLFFFAGHGQSRGNLMAAPTAEQSGDSLVPIHDILRMFRQSPARGLVILDACYAGQALRKPDLELDLTLDAKDGVGRGAIHLLAAGGPEQRIPDGPKGEHSPFTATLLAMLDGRLGRHDAGRFGLVSGTVQVSRFNQNLEAAVAEHSKPLQERLGESWTPPDVLVESIRPSDSGGRSLFHFVPRQPRLDPLLVRGLRTTLKNQRPKERRRWLKGLERELAKSTDDAEKRRWDLPLILDLLLEGLRDLEPQDRLRLETKPLQLGPEREVEDADARALTARSLGRAASAARELLAWQEVEGDERAHLYQDLEDLREALFHLALRDTDPVVRHAAAKALPRGVADLGHLEVRRQLWQLRRDAPRLARHRLRILTARAEQAQAKRLATGALVLLAGAIDLARRGWRTRLVRLPMKLALWAGAALYGLIFFTYHVDTAPDGRLIAQLGPPGLDALPLAGDLELSTPWYEGHLAARRLPRNPSPWGFWITSGGLDWRRPIVRLLRDEHAVPALWRLGEPDQARRRLRAWAQRGRPEAVAWAAYQSIHDPEAVDVIDLAERVLQRHRTGGTERERLLVTVRHWCAISETRPNREWPPPLREACRLPANESIAANASAPGHEESFRPKLDLPALARDLASTESATRSDALRRLAGTIERNELEAQQMTQANQLLAASLGDAMPWNQLEAAEGVLILSRAPEAIYSRALSLIVRELDRGTSGGAGQRLAARFATATAASILRLLTRLGEHLVASQTDPFVKFVYNDLIERLIKTLTDREPAHLEDAVDALLPLIGSAATEESAWRWRSSIAGNLKRVIDSHPWAGVALSRHLLANLETDALEERRAAAWLLSVCRPWLEDPAAARSRLADLILDSTSEKTRRGEPSDAVWLAGAAFTLAELSREDPESRRHATSLLIHVLTTPATPDAAKPKIAWHLRSLSAPITPSRNETEALWSLTVNPVTELRSTVASCFLSWIEREPAQWVWLSPHVERRLRQETDLETRASWWAAYGMIRGDKTSLDAVQALGSIHDRGGRSALLHAGLLGSTRPEAAGAVIAAIDARWRHDELLGPLGITLAARQLGRRDPELARRVLDEVVEPMLLEQPGHAGSNAITNGISAFTNFHPILAKENLSRLDTLIHRLETGQVTLGESSPIVLNQAIERSWLDIAATRLDNEPQLIERRLRSLSGWQRGLARKLLIEIAKEFPERRPDLKSLVEKLRSAWHPDVRVNATRCLENLNLLELDEALGPPQREALRSLAEITSEAEGLF